MSSIGEQMRYAFLDSAPISLEAMAGAAPRPLVLRLDRSTVQMPWELARIGQGFLSCIGVVARQLEASMVGRTAPQLDRDEGKTNVLVVGDPRGDLPGASAEASAVSRMLARVRGVRLKRLIGRVSYGDLSQALDDAHFDIVHYAGHAEHDPLRGTALVLRDTVMTAEDLATRRYVPRLFFANGCYAAQSGGPLEFVLGLPTLVTGLLSAGVRAFLGASWAVDDRAAKTFATAFLSISAQRKQRGRCDAVSAPRGRRRAWRERARMGSVHAVRPPVAEAALSGWLPHVTVS